MVNYSRKTLEVLLGQACAVMVSDKHWGGGRGGSLEKICSLPTYRVLMRLKWEAKFVVKVISKVKVIQMIMLYLIPMRKAQQPSYCSQDYNACQWYHMSWFFLEINCYDIQQCISSLSPTSCFIIIQACFLFSEPS